MPTHRWLHQGTTMAALSAEDRAWRVAFGQYYRRVLPWGLGLGLLGCTFLVASTFSLGWIWASVLTACCIAFLLGLSTSLYTSLRRWRRRGRFQHYVTWIMCSAAVMVPPSMAFYIILASSAPPGTEVDFGGGPLFLPGIVLWGIVLGAVTESVERAIASAQEQIAARQARPGSAPGAV